MRRSRIRLPTWSSIAAVDRPLFGFAILFTRPNLPATSDRGGVSILQRDNSRRIPIVQRSGQIRRIKGTPMTTTINDNGNPNFQ
jgi:hypothetical protein